MFLPHLASVGVRLLDAMDECGATSRGVRVLLLQMIKVRTKWTIKCTFVDSL